MPEEIKDRIRTRRKELEVPQKQLAEMMGIAPSAFSQYETGYRIPGAEVLVKLALVLGVTTDYLLGVRPIMSFGGPLPRKVIIDGVRYVPMEKPK